MNVIFKGYIGITFLILSIQDFYTKTLSLALTLPLIISGILYQTWNHQLKELCLGIIAGSLPLLGIRAMGNYVLKKESLGLGDIFLLTGIGAWFGPLISLKSLYWACIFAGFPAFILLITRKKETSPSLPFGPFLILGCLVALYHIGTVAKCQNAKKSDVSEWSIGAISRPKRCSCATQFGRKLF